MSELADEVLRIVHAFSDDDRRNAVRQLAARIAHAERRLAQAERVVEAARRVSVDNAFIRALPELDDELERYDAERAKLGTASDA